MDQKLELLSKVPLFADLGQRDLGQVERLADEIDVPAGKVLAKEGSSAHEFFVIVEGRIAITRGATKVNDMGPGEFFGELAMLGRIPRTATATASTPARLLVVGHREFTSLMANHPQIREKVLRSAAKWIAALAPERAN
jgi:CRP-like cAMP-binding protein